LSRDLRGAATGAARLLSSIMSGEFADEKAASTLLLGLTDAAQQ
jgi:hypothetical protein